MLFLYRSVSFHVVLGMQLNFKFIDNVTLKLIKIIYALRKYFRFLRVLYFQCKE